MVCPGATVLTISPARAVSGASGSIRSRQVLQMWNTSSAGYDAIRKRPNSTQRLQIKGLCILPTSNRLVNASFSDLLTTEACDADRFERAEHKIGAHQTTIKAMDSGKPVDVARQACE
jgi:hypothetical protein